MTKHRVGPKSLAMIAAAVLAKRPNVNVREQIKVAKMASKVLTATTPKRKSRTVTVTDRERNASTGSGGELAQSRLTYGKARNEKLPMVLRANVERIFGRITQANQFDANTGTAQLPGAMALAHVNLGGAAATTQLPMVLIDVTSWFNNVGTDGAYSAFTVWRPEMAVSSGNITWNNVGPQWTIEKTSGVATSSVSTGTASFGSDVLKSVIGKMLFYGATSKPTKFSLSLISLKKDYLIPDFQQSSGAGAALGLYAQNNENFRSEHTACWQDYARWTLFNPILTGQPRMASKIKTHASHNFIIQQKESFEPNANTGHMRIVNINLHPERLQRYDWSVSGYATHPVMETSAITSEQAQPANVVAPTKRMYLAVRAMSSYSTAVSNALQPSFDFNLRAIHEIVA